MSNAQERRTPLKEYYEACRPIIQQTEAEIAIKRAQIAALQVDEVLAPRHSNFTDHGDYISIDSSSSEAVNPTDYGVIGDPVSPLDAFYLLSMSQQYRALEDYDMPSVRQGETEQEFMTRVCEDLMQQNSCSSGSYDSTYDEDPMSIDEDSWDYYSGLTAEHCDWGFCDDLYDERAS